MNPTLQSRPPISINLPIRIIGLNPDADISKGWKFEEGAPYGPQDNDGVSAFFEVIYEASSRPEKERHGYGLLFADGIAKKNINKAENERRTVLAGVKLADPDLLWSLYKEPRQAALRCFYDVWGVKWLAALRRAIVDTNGDRGWLYLYRQDDGSWYYRCLSLDQDRHANLPILILGQ